MYGYENAPHVAGVNAPHMAGVNAPHVAGVNVAHHPMHCGYSYAAPAYECCTPNYGRNPFALLVVLFILLIIIGATIYGNKC